MALGFKLPIDIANRALQHLGARRIASFSDNSKNAAEASAAYDKARRSELRKSVWNFATRRAGMRKISSSTVRIVPAQWSAVTTYAALNTVQDPYGGSLWISRRDSNLNNSPVELGGTTQYWTSYTGPQTAEAWDASLTYMPGELVTKSAVCYIAKFKTGNLNQDPATQVAYWGTFSAAGFASDPLYLPTPLGYSPDASVQRNLFFLPYGFIRMAPQDPQSPSSPRLGVSAEMRYRDWELEHGFLMSEDDAGPMVLRYVADVSDVREMDDLFCEALAARIAMDLAEMLTQSPGKEQKAQGVYANFMKIAKDINAVEMGSSENDENPDEPLLQAATAGVPAQRGQ